MFLRGWPIRGKVVLSTEAKLYIGAVSCAGLGVVLASAFTWSTTDPVRFLAYFLLTAIASGLKVTLPGVYGTMSVSYVFILLSIVELSFGEVVAISVLSALVQLYWHAKERPRLVHVIFNSSFMAITAAVSYAAYHFWPAHWSMVLALASAACAYFLSNTLAVAGVLAVTEHKPMTATWKNSYFWSFPYYLLGASLAALMGYLEKFFNWEVGLALLPMLFIIYRSYGIYLGRLEEQKQHAEATASLHLRTIEALALAIEAKDQTTGDHLRRVQIYAREIAQDLGLPEDVRLALQAASILHDVGKIAVPDYIISKPGRLTPEEFKKMKVHPLVGAEIIERIDFPYPVAPIVRAHHEKWDGSGYPFGLREEQIPIGARILAAVDCFDALASDRQYRKALPLDQVLSMVQAEAGKSFDPHVVEILCRRHLELEEISAADQTPVLSKFAMDFDVECGNSPAAGFESAVAANTSQAGLEASLQAIAGAHQQGQDLYELVRGLGHALTPTDLMALICARLNAVVPCDSMAIFVLQGNVLKPQHAWGENSQALSSLRIPLGQGVCGWVAENLKPILNGNPLVEPGYSNDPNRSIALRSVLAVPLHTTSRAFGVIALYKTETDGFSRDHLRALAAINSKISLALDRALFARRGDVQSRVDPITGLPNARAVFLHIEAEIARCRATGSGLTLLVCDLDGFKKVNDLYGQLAGDRVLRSVASGLRQHCREYDYLARRGGDEFVLVLPRLSGEALNCCAGALADVVQDACNEFHGDELLSLSIGTATFPEDGDNPETLLAEADRRMYISKQARSNGALTKSAIETLAQISDLLADKKSIPEMAARDSSFATQALP